jgi:SAM-dependent methyltransferase
MMNGQKQNSLANRVWRRLSRHSFTKHKISRNSIRRFTRKYASQDRTLIIHPEEGLEDFPNHFIVSKRVRDNPDLLVDSQFVELAKIASGTYDTILCAGLLEHLSRPQEFVDNLHRILRPGGRAIIRCSSCFSLHECPDDYFHYTPFGLKILFERWSRFELLSGSCGPFETIAILLQRIHMQCEIAPPLRPLIEVMFHTFPLLDRFIIRQYDKLGWDKSRQCDSMLPSNIQAVVVK